MPQGYSLLILFLNTVFIKTAWRPNSMDKLTARQQQVLDHIQKYFNDSGFPPTIIELANALGVRSANAIRDHLRALERKGAIELTAGASRGIRLCLEEKNLTTGLPLIGQVAAGAPILATEHVESYQQVERSLFKPHADYLLRVRGMSMCKASILDGDLLVVHKTSVAQNGQIVVARIDQEVTVKRFKQIQHMVYLLPENDDFSAIEIDLRDTSIAIEGIGIGVIRNQLN